ncbi:MAG: hypothetical protein EX260_08760 [Desulfobulbaceae bacterium]|nr:MAG: hypothetical protein EX260_08760 [Desulfobulbaceae bacterium]
MSPIFLGRGINMCTVSWWKNGSEYGLLFNRDESRKRLDALPPRVHNDTGCRYLSPIDADAGGTWVFVNQYGLIGCILNNYPSQAIEMPKTVSRGLLLKSLGCQQNIDSVQAAITQTRLMNYQAFFILVMQARSMSLFTWDGARLIVSKDDAIKRPLTTSGYRTRDVTKFRIDTYKELCGADAEPSQRQLACFHSQFHPDFPAHSVLMSRPETRTVSQSQIRVTSELITFSYASVSQQCRLQPAVTITLSREN